MSYVYELKEKNGKSVKVKSDLPLKDVLRRMDRLSTLIVLTEQHDCEEGISVCKKALRAYNKLDGFTGIIRLTFSEKDWLSYMLENGFNDEDDIACIKFYSGVG